jgi:hypothetical protein
MFTPPVTESYLLEERMPLTSPGILATRPAPLQRRWTPRFVASVAICLCGALSASASASVASCPTVKRPPDSAGAGPFVTASCLPKLALMWIETSSANEDGPTTFQDDVTMSLEPRILDQTVPTSGLGYAVSFYPGPESGSFSAQSQGPTCGETGTLTGPASDFFVGSSFHRSIMYMNYDWLPDPFGTPGPPDRYGEVYNYFESDEGGRGAATACWFDATPGAQGGFLEGVAETPLRCSSLTQGGSLAGGKTVTYALQCTASDGVTSWTGKATFNEPPCQRKRTGTGYAELLPAMKTKLQAFYDALDEHGGCYRFTLGYRSAPVQQQLHDHWHQIADSHGPEDHRSAATVNVQLSDAGFAQNVQVTSSGAIKRDNDGVATGGPCDPSSKPCRHVAREAADIRWWFRPFGEQPFKSTAGRFQQLFLPLVHTLAHHEGLCGPPTSDPVHVQLPYQVGAEVTPNCHGFG